jgi:hypothetical protein
MVAARFGSCRQHIYTAKFKNDCGSAGGSFIKRNIIGRVNRGAVAGVRVSTRHPKQQKNE